MQSDFNSVPQNLITATIDSNETRKKFIAEDIISKKPNQVGIYRLIMKKGSDNFRESAIFDIINLLKKANIKIIVYEPKLKELTAEFDHLVNDLKTFKSQSELIIANRIEDDLLDVLEKVYTRDIFHNN
jgi:UDPglucose 6-dehydrogenase